MPLFVYLTERCIADATKHGLTSELERFQNRVETVQSTSFFDPFPPPYLVKKKLGGNQGRLIASRESVGDHAVIVFLAIMIRGNRDYEDEFAVDAIAYGEKHFKKLIRAEELENFVDERTRTSPPPVKPQPNDDEYGFLYNAFKRSDDSELSGMVFETKQWVENVTRDRIKKQIALLCKPCRDALYEETGLRMISIDQREGWGIWAYCQPGRMLLISPYTDETSHEAESLARQISLGIERSNTDEFYRLCSRSYPALLLADDELWIDLEKETELFMALSPEESQVLESANNSEHPFPLFINGRAGSGKSTILQYLFTDLLCHFLSMEKGQVMKPPLYLTANGELLRIARGIVERLLTSRSKFTQSLDATRLAKGRAQLDEAFREFGPHLLSLVPKAEREVRFVRRSRVDYSRFRNLWVERFGKDKLAFREFTPDLSWHVIRSYIKGMGSESFLDSDDYLGLPEKQKSVTPKAFQLVYDRVWKDWYRPLLVENNLWDDQDLTRFILERDLAKPLYPAVLCDEAQDFTRLELELLLRFNLFSQRGIPANDISRVCFAFAGDQFQTLNPTGFRWDAMKASFVEKFIFELDPARRSGRTDLNYRELKYNYRSTHKIVRFGNNIQAMRAALFQMPELRPQIPWSSEVSAFPVFWFHSNDAEFWRYYKQNANFVIIVPCGEGEEIDYVKDDEILSQYIQLADGIPVNVLSAVRAKGCEYPSVIVYGFGSMPESSQVKSFLMDGFDAVDDQDESLPLQYFINRLYVAVSRPKQRLVIVDSPGGMDKLWRFATDETTTSSMLDSVRNGQAIWSEQIDGMIMGKPENLVQESPVDPLEFARMYERDAQAKNDAFLYRQAARAYSEIDPKKSDECYARAYKIENLFYAAGDKFFKVGFTKEGIDCLWSAGRPGWKRLHELSVNHPRVSNEIEVRFATCIIEPPGVEEIIKVIEQFAVRLDDSTFVEICLGEKVWRDALTDITKLLLGRVTAGQLHETSLRISRSLDKIRSRKILFPVSQFAQIYFNAENFGAAAALWEEANETKHEEYLISKAEAESYPQRVLALSKLKRWSTIVDSYLESAESPLSSEQAEIVVDALIQSAKFQDAFDLCTRVKHSQLAFHFASLARRSNEALHARNSLRLGFTLLVQQKSWDIVADFLSSGVPKASSLGKDKDLMELARNDQQHLIIVVIRALARSKDLVDAPSDFKKSISSALMKQLSTKDRQLVAELSLQEAGAAIERAGRFTDGLTFYESMRKKGQPVSERRFIDERWLVCKQRQHEYEKAQGNASKSDEIRRQMLRMVSKLGVDSAADLPDYPALSPTFPIFVELVQKGLEESDYPVGTTAEEDSRLDITVLEDGKFKIEFSKRNNRCNITNRDTMETAFIKVKDRTFGGEVQFVESSNDEWVCVEWNLSVQFIGNSGEPLVIEHSAPIVKLKLRCP